MTASAGEVTATEKKALDHITVHGVDFKKGEVIPMNAERARSHARGLMARKYGENATFKMKSFVQAPGQVVSLTNHDYLANVEVVTGRAPEGTPVQISTFFIHPGA